MKMMDAARRMGRSGWARRAHATVLLCMGGAARAELPAILDRVPEDAAAALIVPELSRLDREGAKLTAALGLTDISSLSQAAAIMGLREGLDFDGGLAIVWPASEVAFDIDRAVALLPCLDGDVLLRSLGVKEPGEGTRPFQYNGVAYFARKFDGGLVGVATEEAVLKTFAPDPGRSSAHERALGPRGAEIAERAPIMLMARGDKAGELLRTWLGAAPVTDDSGAPIEGVREWYAEAVPALERIAEHVRCVTIGAGASAAGLRLEAAFAFEAGSEFERLCSGARASGPLLTGLPGGRFVFAIAARLSNDAMRALLRDAVTEAENAADASDTTGLRWLASAVRAMTESQEVESGAVAAYAQGTLPMTGLLGRCVSSWNLRESGDGTQSGFRDAFRAALQRADSPERRTAYSAEAARVRGVAVDHWSIAGPDPNTPVMPALFGPLPVARGMLAVIPGRAVVMTVRDDELMGKALGAADEGESISADRSVQQLAGMLPRPSDAYVIFSVAPLTPLLGMILRDVELPQEIAPIGAGLALREGAAHAGVFIPADVLKLALAVSEARRNAGTGP